MFGELHEHCFERGSADRELKNLFALKLKVAQELKDSAEAPWDLVHLLLDLEIGFEHVSVLVVDSHYFLDGVDVVHEREALLDCLFQLILLAFVSYSDLVSLAVLLLQVVWASVASESAVDHDGKIVTE